MAEAPVKVLLVEDDEDDYVLARDLLRQVRHRRHELTWVREFDEAMGRACAREFDVCLVDYQLGERNGIDFVRQAVSLHCPAPIILLTGHGDLETDVAAMEAGAADFLHKAQITPDLLERSIRYAIQNRRIEDQRLRLMSEQAARIQAEAASRAKDQFLAALSHELRTPLTPVLMAVSLLEQDPELPTRFRDDVEMIKRNVEMEARLIDDLLDLTRIARGKLTLHRQPADVHALVSRAVETCYDEFRAKNLRMDVHARAAQHHVQADPARLQQVLWNLIKNAVKFTPEGGCIEVRTSNPQPQTLRIDVSDTGIGIDPAVLPRIFDAFEQGSHAITQNFGGLGLGLAICRKLVELHGGKIWAQSAGRGQGATFSVELTAIQSEQTAGAGPGQAPTAEARRLSILLVEDHESTSRMMVRLLRGNNHEVISAPSIDAATKLAQNRRFDLVVSDLGLPDGSGLDLMRHLKQRYGLKGIALSGFGMEEDIRRSHDAGFEEHLVKPVNLHQLEQAITRVATGAGNESKQS